MTYLDYLPGFLRGIRDFQGLGTGTEPETEWVRNWCRKVQDECGAETAGEEGLSRFERMLGLQDQGTLTLEQRRMRVLGMLRNLPPFSMGWLLEKLLADCGEGNFYATQDTEHFRLQVGVDQKLEGSIASLYHSLRQSIPANMELHMGLLYRTKMPGRFGGVMRTGDSISGKEPGDRAV